MSIGLFEAPDVSSFTSSWRKPSHEKRRGGMKAYARPERLVILDLVT